jgi:hypothetical protein
MQLLGTVLIVQTLPVSHAGTYFAIVAAANFISSFSDFGFCQYSFRYVTRGVPLDRVYAGAIIVSAGGIVLSTVIGAAAAAIVHLPIVQVAESVFGSSVQKLTSINRYALLRAELFARAMLLDGVQPTIFVVVMAIYIGWLWVSGSGDGVLGIVCLIYLGSFVFAFPIGVMIGRTRAHWGASIGLCRLARRKSHKSIVRAIRRSILLALEWNSLVLWMSFLVLWFEVAGYHYETAVAGVFQRVLNMIRVGTGVSLQMNLTYYYTAWITPSYLMKLVREAAQLGCALTVACLLVDFAVPLIPVSLTRLSIFTMGAEITSYPILVGAICALDYIFFHLSFFALGLNRKIVRVIAPIIGIGVLIVAGGLSEWLPSSDRFAFGLFAYVISLFAGGSVLLFAIIRYQGRVPAKGLRRRKFESNGEPDGDQTNSRALLAWQAALPESRRAKAPMHTKRQD